MEANLWCDLCNLSVSCETNMIEHLKGKKHLANLKETFISESVIPAGAKLPDTSSAQSVVQTRWTCELCETTVSSDLTFQFHLRGKKHRAKAKLWCDMCNLSVSCETNMIAHLKGKKHLAKLKETFISESVIPTGAKLPDTSSAQSVVQTRWTCELCETTVSSDLTFQFHLRGKKHRAKAKLWCDMCNLSVSCETNMIAHLKGKKHLAKLKETFISESVIPAGAKLPDTSSAQSVVQTRWTCELCETTVSSDLTFQFHLRGKNHRAKAKLWCDLCNLSVSCETKMIAHLDGKKHLAKLKETFTNPGSS